MRRSQDLDYLFEAILTLQSVDECYLYFEDVCTIKELQSMAQRMQVAKQLNANKNYLQVYEDTGVSSATISRVNKCLQYGSDGYRLVLERIREKEEKSDDTE